MFNKFFFTVYAHLFPVPVEVVEARYMSYSINLRMWVGPFLTTEKRLSFYDIHFPSLYGAVFALYQASKYNGN